MTPRKSRPLLWELSKNPTRTVTNRLRPNRAVRPEPARADGARDSAIDGGASPPPSTALGPDSDFVSEIMPLLESDGFGLHFHLRWPMVAVVGMALAVIVLAAFAIGRVSVGTASNASTPEMKSQDVKTPTDAPANASKPAVRGNEPSRGRTDSPRIPATPPSGEPVQPVKPEARGEAASKPVETQPAKTTDSQPAADEPAGPVKLVAGYTYIIVQHFPKSQRSTAEKAATFLRGKGVPAAILSGADLRLIVNEAFAMKAEDATKARQESQRLKDWLEYVKKTGVEYEKVGGYNFSKAYSQEEH